MPFAGLGSGVRTTRARRAPGKGEFSGLGEGEKYFEKTKDFYRAPTELSDYYSKKRSFFDQPTQAERTFERSGRELFTRGLGEQYAQHLAGMMARPGVGQLTAGDLLRGGMGQAGAANQAQQAWQQFQQNVPRLAEDPGLGSYYANAKRRAAEDIRQKMASAGAYGSSATADQTAEAMVNLEAERANREAQYNLSRLAEQRAWEGLGGQLAGQASGAQLGWTTGLGQLGLGAEGLGLSREQAALAGALGADRLGLERLTSGLGIAQGVDQATLNRLLAGGQLAGQVDTAALNRIMAGQGAAAGAQQLGAQRGMEEFQKTMGLLGMALPTVSTGYENLFASDQALRDAAAAAGVGGGLEAIMGRRAQKEGFMSDIAAIPGIYGAYETTFG